MREIGGLRGPVRTDALKQRLVQHPAKGHEPVFDDEGADITAIEHHELDDIFQVSEGAQR